MADTFSVSAIFSLPGAGGLPPAKPGPLSIAAARAGGREYPGEQPAHKAQIQHGAQRGSSDRARAGGTAHEAVIEPACRHAP